MWIESKEQQVKRYEYAKKLHAQLKFYINKKNKSHPIKRKLPPSFLASMNYTNKHKQSIVNSELLVNKHHHNRFLFSSLGLPRTWFFPFIQNYILKSYWSQRYKGRNLVFTMGLKDRDHRKWLFAYKNTKNKKHKNILLSAMMKAHDKALKLRRTIPLTNAMTVALMDLNEQEFKKRITKWLLAPSEKHSVHNMLSTGALMLLHADQNEDKTNKGVELSDRLFKLFEKDKRLSCKVAERIVFHDDMEWGLSKKTSELHSIIFYHLIQKNYQNTLNKIIIKRFLLSKAMYSENEYTKSSLKLCANSRLTIKEALDNTFNYLSQINTEEELKRQLLQLSVNWGRFITYMPENIFIDICDKWLNWLIYCEQKYSGLDLVAKDLISTMENKILAFNVNEVVETRKSSRI